MDDRGHQEIIIIKRGNEEEEGHHGGAWKIAFADFMTAMMALFLVLWLINAANEETKRAVASYFNPIKLVDRNRSSRGVQEQTGGPSAIDETNSSSSQKHDEPAEASPKSSQNIQSDVEKTLSETASDAAFFANPMAALDKIEASVLEKSGISSKVGTKGDDPVPGKFTDPFNSSNRQTETSSSESEGTDFSSAHVSTLKPKTNAGLAAEMDKLESEIQNEIAKSLGEDTQVKDAVNITQTEKGILIQITDLPASPMFDIGKAVPNGETVIAINAVAKVVGSKPGKIRIQGHTDSRKFGNVGNGNWQLSVDRAQSVYFILLRAGLVESRFSEISGFADRKPIVASDPLADQNRRIEIFLEQT